MLKSWIKNCFTIFLFFLLEIGLLIVSRDPLFAEDSIDPNVIAKEVLERRSRVSEFQLISNIARQNGVRISLMGGTASSFAHYVTMDLRRETQGKIYRAGYFQYFWDQIFRPGQDLDLLVEADPGQTIPWQKIEASIESGLPGIKVDLHSRADSAGSNDSKIAIDSQDFQMQSSDSMSTGIIGLTSDQVADARFPELEIPQFIKSLSESEIHFIYSEDHEKTPRYKKGLNPPLLAVLRFLINANRYHLKISDRDSALIKEILDKEKTRKKWSDYSISWIERNGNKLVSQAYDIEEAYQRIQNEFPVVDLLKSIRGLSEENRSTLWWLTGSPLPSLAKGTGTGTEKTAEDLGISLLSHGTEAASWQQIQANPEGKPNIMQSENREGQGAVLGSGFYTKKGEHGAPGYGDGHHIRVRIDPKARLDIDFMVFENDWILVLNRDVLHLEDGEIGTDVDAMIHHFHNWSQSGNLPFEFALTKRRLLTKSLASEDIQRILDTAKLSLREGHLIEVIYLLDGFKGEDFRNFRIQVMHELLRHHGRMLKKFPVIYRYQTLKRNLAFKLFHFIESFGALFTAVSLAGMSIGILAGLIDAIIKPYSESGAVHYMLSSVTGLTIGASLFFIGGGLKRSYPSLRSSNMKWFKSFLDSHRDESLHAGKQSVSDRESCLKSLSSKRLLRNILR